MKPEDRDAADSDWESRTLCSDESCIGVIGPDGRCKECGRPYEGELPSAFPNESALEEIEDQDLKMPDSGPGEEMQDGKATAIDDDWAKRKLCSDESCIGVIGPDGRCKECGKPS